jgi:uncharacterized membrane protein
VGRSYNNSGAIHAVRVKMNQTDPTIQQFTDLGQGTFESEARGISLNGIVVGSSATDSSSIYKTPAYWSCTSSPTNISALHLTGNAMAVATDIAGKNYVTGFVRDETLNGTFGFLHPIGNLHNQLPTTVFSDFQNWPQDINDTLVVTGFGLDNGFQRAFVCDDPNDCYFLERESFFSIANGINNNQQPLVVGTVLDATTFAFTATLWGNGQQTLLPHLPQSTSSYALAISDGGDIVGHSGQKAAIWRDGIPHDLNTLLDNDIGIPLINAIDINRHGEILAHANGGKVYLLIPVENFDNVAY